MKKILNKARLRNQLIAVISIMILASCSSGTAENDDLKSKQTQLSEYKQQVHELELKISKLQKEIKAHAKLEYIEVVTSKIEANKFEHFIEVTGSVEADQELNVSPEGSGQIIDILVKEGQRVSAGTVLAILNSEPIDRNIEELKINLELAKTTFERQKNLWNQNIGSELQFLQTKSTKEALEQQLKNLLAQKDKSIIKSPINGTVDVIYQKRGQIANAQIPFARLINIEKIKIYADIAESYLIKIKEGDETHVYFPAIEKNVLTTIQMIGNYIDPNNRTFRIRLDLKNKDKQIKPNLEAVVKVRDYLAEQAIVIPSLLIKEDFKGKYTFIATGSEKQLKAMKIYIKTGVSDNNMTEVIEGLDAGMQVISEGFTQVIDGSPIKAN